MASIGTLVTTQTVLARTAGALFGLELGSTAMNSLAASAGSTTASQTAFLNTLYANSVGASTANSVVVSVVLANLGIPTTDTAVYNGVSAYLQAQLDAVPYAARGGVLNDVLTLFSTLTASPYVVAYNTKISAAEAYAAVSTNTSNATFDTVSSTPSTTGTTFTLTTAADNFTGTANPDIFNGTVDQATPANSTLGASDIINGGSGIDTLNITGTGTTLDALNGALVTGVEIVNIRATTADTFNASQIAGVTTVNNNMGAGTLGVTNLATGASIGVIGNGTVLNGTTSYAYKTAADAQTINISGGTTGGNITATASTAVTTATINTTGTAANTVGTILMASAAANTITSLTVNAAASLAATLTAADFSTSSALVVKGAATNVAATSTAAADTAVNLGTAGAFKTIDASGLTAGGLTIGLNAITTSFKGGLGNDTVTTATLTATVAGQVDAGAGTGDRLIVGAAGDVNSSTKGAEFVNFEILRDNVATTAIDVSLISGITSIELNNTAATVSNLTATQAAAVTVLATDAGGTISLANSGGTSDVLSLTLQNLSPANVATKINFSTATVDGFETLNVAVNSGIATAMTTTVQAATNYDLISFTSASTLKSIVATGAYDVDINAASNAVKVTLIDVSGNTSGGTTIETGGQTGTLVVTGSNATDIVTLGTMGAGGLQTINSGSGNDTITGTYAQVAVATINGGAGTDTIAFTDTTGTIADNTFQNVSGVEKVTLAATTDFSLTVGGYANALATANGGVLDITATALNVTTGAVVLDASGLSGTNSLKFTESNANATASAGSFAITESAGADNITMVGAGAGNLDTITITGGTAALASTLAKTIDLSGVSTGGAIAVTTGAGNDVIKAAAIAGTYTSGAGQDAITAGAGTDTIVVGKGTTASGAAGINMDTITNFASGTDKLQLTSGASGTGSLLGLTLAGGNTAAAMGAVITDTTSVASLTDVYNQLAVDLTAGTFAASTAGAGTIVARVVTLSSGSAAGSYLVIDDSVAGFQAANDIVIKLTGATTFAAGDITVV